MKRIAVTAVALLALAAPAVASAHRPSAAEAEPVTERIAAKTAEGLTSFGIFEVEHVSASCSHLRAYRSHRVLCDYAIWLRNVEDGSRQTCDAVAIVSKRNSGRVFGRSGGLRCFD
jgi:hypothetical protein